MEHAMNDNWESRAYMAARMVILKTRGYFLAETILPAVIDMAGEPKDRRSFGTVMTWLRANGYIKPAGYSAARTSHNSPKRRWVKA
jgi:hypothetical protein